MRMKNKTQSHQKGIPRFVSSSKDSFQQQAVGPPGGATGQLPAEECTTAPIGVSDALGSALFRNTSLVTYPKKRSLKLQSLT